MNWRVVALFGIIIVGCDGAAGTGGKNGRDGASATVSGTGTAAAPFATMNAAATAAASLTGSVELRVAAGAYTLAATVTVPARTSILAGYTTADWNTRDAVANMVTVNASPVYVAFSLQPGSVKADGLRVTTTQTGSAQAVTCFSVDSSATLSNNACTSRNQSSTSNACIDNSVFTSLKNNDFFDCGSYMISGAPTLTDVNALTNASGNISFDLVDGSNTFFVNEATDWRLSTGGTGGFLTAKTGGLDLSSVFTTDLLGVTRTANSGIGWSMGAYEQDL